MQIGKELMSSLESLVILRMKIHTASVNAELQTGQPQYPLISVLETLDKTIVQLTKETRAVCEERKPLTGTNRFKSLLGLRNE